MEGGRGEGKGEEVMRLNGREGKEGGGENCEGGGVRGLGCEGKRRILVNMERMRQRLVEGGVREGRWYSGEGR